MATTRTLALCLALFSGASASSVSRTNREDADPVRFENVAAAAGIDFVLRNDAVGRKYQVETMLGGVVVIDFDNDGWPDIYAANGAALPSLQKNDPRFHNRLYRNNRDGTFADVTQRAGVSGKGYSMGAAVGDFDNDGWEDLYVVGVNENILYRNNSDGTFVDITRSAGVDGRDSSGRKLWSVAAAWLDYDNDGDLDLWVSNYCEWSPGSDPVCGGLARSARTYCSPDSYRGQPNLLYRNEGRQTFKDVSLETGVGKLIGKGMGVAVSDFNNDGYPDVFVAHDNARNQLFRNLANGRFEEIGIPAGVAFNGDGRPISGMGADFRDYDGDGRPDIVMTGLRRETFELFRNLDGQEFADVSAESGILRLSQPWSGWSCAFVDFDNDGWRDFFVANGDLDVGGPQPNRLFRNNGRGHFVDASREAGPDLQVSRLHRGAALADFDNDGRVDVVVSALNEPLEVLMNRGPRRRWLRLKLRGTRSNRSALGTRVSCRTKSFQQVAWVANSVGYASASDLRVHFGLGADTLATEIEVRWPSGKIQKLERVAADQVLELVEPTS
jgi:hypothetical protein